MLIYASELSVTFKFHGKCLIGFGVMDFNSKEIQ